ncbi:LysR family transcriptional regulator [Wukongibacter baidiensis]|uniref:LysR family transcriptional regulator n=1 Tax=Wukongibacter baidiensis TaxID=1723361 RepID=UPI003D7F6CC1
MDFKLLKSFITIAHTESFSKAAEILNYAQSSISEQIKKLENQLGTVLFERLGSRIRLTKDGRIFLSYAEKILNLYDEAVANLSPSSPQIIKGELRIAITETLCFYSLPELLRDYHKLYPHVDIKIKMGNCYDFPSWIRKNIIDIAFVLDDKVDNQDIVSEILFNEPLVLVVSKHHSLATKKTISPNSLKNENLILTQKGSKYRSLFESYLVGLDIFPSSLLEFESTEAIKHFVINGLGISFLPRSTIKKELLNGDLHEISLQDTSFTIPAQVLYHNNKWISPALQALLDLTHNLVKNTK